MPLGVLFALNLVDELDREVLTTLAPEIRRSFDLSNAALGALGGAGVAVVVLLGIPFAVLGDRGWRRTRMAASRA